MNSSSAAMADALGSDPQPPPLDPKGLPPVQAPSGRHIVQLFLVPGLIVAVAVTILLGFSWLATGSRTPDQFLKNIESANSDIRWRAASDLAQVLKRDDALASDVGFALSLTERYVSGLTELERLEREWLEARSKSAGDAAPIKKQLIAQRNYVQYLGASLGNFSVPVAAPVLAEVARNGRGKDDLVRVLVRRQAVWALANLGESTRRFDKLSANQKAAALATLETERTAGDSARRTWAEAAHGFMNSKSSMGVVAALVECSREERDIFLRVQVAHALIFWEGDADEKKAAERALAVLARDAGRGERIEVADDDPAPK